MKSVTDNERMNIFVNLVIDRMLEDRKNGILRFTKI